MAGRSLRRRHAAARAWEAEHGPDQAEIACAFTDDWTIRNIWRHTDALRESELMRHCLALALAGGLEAVGFGPSGLLHDDHYLVSLRDPHNFPRVTFVLDRARRTINNVHARGTRGTLPPDYAQRIAAFLHSDIPALTEPIELLAASALAAAA